jgi:hypothetical protein
MTNILGALFSEGDSFSQQFAMNNNAFENDAHLVNHSRFETIFGLCFWRTDVCIDKDFLMNSAEKEKELVICCN